MPREFPRSRRVKEAIQRILGEAVSCKVRDPRLTGVTITDVGVSRDLSVAKVYYTLLSGDSPRPEVADAFRSATGFLRSALARELRLRQVPELRFLPDEALSRGRSLEALIEKAVSQDGPADDKPGPEGS